MTAMRKNAELTAELLGLTDEAKAQSKHEVEDEMMKEERDELVAENKVLRTRWRMMKSVIEAIVAGSGIDWSRDDKLRELLLDTTSDEE
jgi:hypothetical protein